MLRVKRDIKGPLPVRVRLGLGYGMANLIHGHICHI